MLEAEAPVTRAGVDYPSKYAMWGLAAEVQSWGYAMPSAAALLDALFGSGAPQIEWSPFPAYAVHKGSHHAPRGPGVCMR